MRIFLIGPLSLALMTGNATASRPRFQSLGDLPGGPVRAFRRGSDGSLEPQPACAGVELVPGQTIVSVSSGGGGYGAPWRRDPERVAHDVREGWVSRGRAAEVYGVELDETDTVVADATGARRARLAESS